MRRLGWCAFLLLVVASACTSNNVTESTNATPSTSVSSPASTATSSVTVDASQVPTGLWEGRLTDPVSSFERLILGDCDLLDACGEIEYMDPMQPTMVLCAPALVYMALEGESFVFEERPAYRPDQCFPTTLKMRYIDEDTLAVDQYGEPQVVCCTGTFDRVRSPHLQPRSPKGHQLKGSTGRSR